MEIDKGVRAEKIIKALLEELEHIRRKVSILQDDIDNCISKTTDEIRKNLSYVYSELDTIRNELKDFCIGDCSLCPRNCTVSCDVDCSDCVRFWKCLSEKKVSFSPKI